MKRLDVVLGSVLGLEIAVAALASAPGPPNLGDFTNGLGLFAVLGLLLLVRRGHRWPWLIVVVLTVLSMNEFLADGFTAKGFGLLALSGAELAALLCSPMREHLRKPRTDALERSSSVHP